MKDKKLVPDAAAYNVRIMGKVLAKSKPETVLKIVQEMEENGLKPDTITHNYLIDCYCKNGKFKEAREVYEGLGGKGCEANYRTYKVYMMELCKKGDLNGGLEVFGDALKEKKVPDLGAVKILVEKLVKEKRVRAAKRVVTGLRKKFEKDFVGGWLELEKIVGLDKNDGGEEDEKVVEA
ncbi:uncharacterized protein A4U43_C03F24310 [Asparagus officinalis]|uniref:Pentacotripeptide-repeat region of PRORP domain-containing protein n=1 Tax=Asparagus officinalis TaxID=4686 RepID=A0A5P1FCL1_ASPOF|nr:pentatricopeptide repeat-containing protein At4g36680, mitochondrial-like [Asparagus officinalis]XP_020257912.1 pentatricopeptide repeat-containing protein At4g36680, mitochondrial-like [Asparagus officinalis]XP_020257913.1 pentatricopeptide repeat-containing protein At4g36680, mitochondrial-like [Asparagus officinalis]ONK76135.1 uncharacterized protein A4U43_C03F24310 [Asparagus officinalis]